jgi:glycerophosphoryl diester phosphodiesterase
MVILLIISLVVDAGYIYMSAANKIDLNILYPTRASITAHRGDSTHAPENTMPAFMLAVENQADILEIDVRQTSDGEYVIMHDESLSRTTGDSHKVGEVNLRYIKNLDAGSFFSEEFAGVVIPTLEEVMEFAVENDVFLNIELKTADTDSEDYVQGIVDIIQRYDYVDKCMLASDNYDRLKELKTLDEDITTLYIMSFAFNNLGSMEYVDAFSIRYNFISADLVKNIHQNDKKIYAWTVDNETQIKRLLLYDVDGIITNDPYNTKDIVYNANNGIVVDLLSRICEAGW